ncbi:MAG: LytTR family DNA-binding domain-containing protein [Bacillota bacterium]|nr:LytTR family DNA-binding domain-containing protein [Bacillota bacterium]
MRDTNAVHIAICDDEPAIRRSLCEMTERWAQGHALPPVRIAEYESAESFLFEYEETKSCDILLLDIEMGAMNGIDLAKTLREKNKTLQIVFVTGYATYFPEGFEVDALHYLLKPVSEQKIAQVLDKALSRLDVRDQMLTIREPGSVSQVPLSEIRYISVQGNYVTIHADRDYTFKQSLSELEKQLDRRFYRLGRSEIVNLQHVRSTTKKETVLTGDIRISLPRGASEKLVAAIVSFF